MIELGDIAKDTVTGYVGTAVSRDEWLNGCIRFGLQRKMKDTDTEMPKIVWVDQDQLVVVEKRTQAEKESPPAGPRALPQSHSIPDSR